MNASNVVDVQATYESAMSLWGAVMGGVNLMEHAAGWLEGGLTASFEKLIVDAEMLQLMRETMTPLQVREEDLGLDAIAEVGPGGHFFGTAHTLERFETAFYEPMLSDWRNFETWQESGAVDRPARANVIWKELLRSTRRRRWIRPGARRSRPTWPSARQRLPPADCWSICRLSAVTGLARQRDCAVQSARSSGRNWISI